MVIIKKAFEDTKRHSGLIGWKTTEKEGGHYIEVVDNV